MGTESYSEYEGGGVMPNTVFPKGQEALTAKDKLRLQSITGQEIDPSVAPNPYHWYGGVTPDTIPEDTRDRDLKAAERDRYRESPY